MSQIKKKQKNQLFHGSLSQSLIQLAVLQISKTNSIDFSLRELAKKLGVSHAAAYKHFKEKKDLLETIALEGFLNLKSSFQKALVGSSNNSAHSLELLGKAYIEFAIQNPGYYRVMFGIHFNNETNEDLHKASLEAFVCLYDVIGKRSKENFKKAMFAWSVVHGWTMLQLEGQVDGLTTLHQISKDDVESFVTKTIALCLYSPSR